MKNIFKSLLMVLSGAMLFTSCLEEAAPLASAVKVDKQELTFEGASAPAQKVKVQADGDWFVIANEEWVKVTPTNGNGETDVVITVSDNVDSYKELNGPRSTVVSFCYGTSGVTPLTVKQLGETGLDASRTYTLITKQEEIVAGSYLIVFKNDGKYIAMEPLVSSKNYGYLNAVEVTPDNNVITMPNASNAFTLESVQTGYNMIMPDNRYVYMTGAYTSFNASSKVADSNPWTLTLNEDGTVKIAAVTHGNYIQFSTTHSSAGAYTSPQDGGLLPYLYKDAKAKSDEVLEVKDVVVPAFADHATIKVKSNKKWTVRNHDSWIKEFTKSGENDGSITVKFDEYTSKTEDRTARFQIIGEGTNSWITLTQSKVALEMTIEKFISDDVATGDYAFITGKIGNIKKADYGNFDLIDETGTVYVYGLYDIDGNKVFTPLGLKEDDVVTLYGKKDVYKDVPQVANGIYISHIASKYKRNLAFASEAVEATLGNEFTAPELSGKTEGVVYSSSETGVATVNPATGAVTLVAVGTTTITATGAETETLRAGTASYTLTVAAKQVRNLEFSAETAEAVLGEEFVAPELSGATEGVVYSSSKPEIATVDAATGAVTVLAAGETTITAAAPETSTHEAGTASYVLTVSEPMSGIEQIKAMATSTSDASYKVNLKDAVVTCVSGNNAYIQDSKAGILLYMKNHGLVAGDVLNGEVSGKVKLYNNLREATAIDYSKAVKTTTTEIPETVLTIAELKASGAYDKYENMRIRIQNAEITAENVLSQNGQTYSIYKKNSSVTGFNQYNYVNVVGYPGKFYEDVQLNVFENATVLGASKTVFSGFNNIEIGVGSTKANKAVASSGATVSYVSANEGVAKVDQQGNVTGVAEGETTITVSVEAYNNYPAAQATCTVTVVPAGQIVETETATITFDNKSKITSLSATKGVWEENGITVTNEKGSSTNDVKDYYKPMRLYQGSKVTVAMSGKKITMIVFDCNTTTYASDLKTSIGSTAEVSVNEDKVTVTLSSPAESFVVAKLAKQVRLDAATVTYQK